MDTKDLVLHLKEMRVSLSVYNGELRVRSAGELPAQVVQSIREKKQELVDLLLARYPSPGEASIQLATGERPGWPLSHAQRRFWLMSQVSDAEGALNITGVKVLRGELDENCLSDALAYVIGRHESLRTVFVEGEGGEVLQRILPVAGALCRPLVEDVSRSSNAWRELEERYQQEQLTGFDLQRGPLLRVRLLKLSDGLHAYLYTLHHIISDGWSMEVFAKEMIGAYNTLKQGHQPIMPPLPLQYKDFTVWQHSQLEGPAGRAGEAYWLAQLAGQLPVLQLPSDKIRPDVKGYAGDSLTFVLPAPLVVGIGKLAAKQSCTLFATLLAGLKALFYRYTSQEDILVGSPIAGREHKDLEGQIGAYLNSIALRTRVQANEPFTELLSRVKETLLNAYRHQSYPFNLLIDQLPVKKDPSRLPVFDVMVAMQNHRQVNSGGATAGLDGLTAEEVTDLPAQKSLFDLSIVFLELDQALHVSIGYDCDVYSAGTVSQLFRHFVQLMESVVQQPAGRVGELGYLSEEEQRELLSWGQVRPEAQPQPAGLLTALTQHALCQPQATALVCGQTRLTYQQLQAQSDQLAHYLREHYGVSAGQVVGLLAERGLLAVVSLLAILKAGAAYLPLDPAHPPQRIADLLAQAGPQLLLTDQALPAYPLATLSLQEQPWLAQPLSAQPLAPPRPEHLAYVLYTSGSTGQPKGVEVRHANLNHFLAAASQLCPCQGPVVLPCLASLTFDISLFQLLTPLYMGGTSLLVPPPVLEDMDQLSAVLQQATVLDTVPAIYTLLLNHIEAQGQQALFGRVEHVFVGGDAVADSLLLRLAAVFPQARISVTYGPTEGTIMCAYRAYAPGTISLASRGAHLGGPMAGCRLYVLDEQAGLLAKGLTGEICIGGAGVAAGYLHQPDLTRAKFTADPYQAGGRLYRTGDLGRWLADGTLVFAGRRDGQVKVRGQRIELAEVEQALARCPGVGQAAVKAWSQGEDKYLAAYLVSENGQRLEGASLRAALGQQLPAYMIPARMVELEQLPLTANGKVDRQALPDPAGVVEHVGAATAPRTELEGKLVDIWQQVLGKNDIGIHDNFFDLGGDSIKSIQLGSRIRKHGYALTVADILRHPVLEEMAAKAQRFTRQAEQGLVTGTVPLSPVQRHFWEQDYPHKHYFNQSVLLRSKAAIDVEGIRHVFTALCAHHDGLRTRYLQEGGEERQEIEVDANAFSLDVYDWREHGSVRIKALIAAASQDIQAGIDLQAGPLVKLGLFQCSDGDRLLIVIHHLVVDGIAWRVLLEDITTLYHQHEQGLSLGLPPKSDSLQYWMAQQHAYAQSSVLLREIPYWKKLEMTGGDPLMPPGVPVKTLEADVDSVSFSLDAATTQQLQTIANKAYNTQVEDILLTALGISFCKVMGTQQLLIDLEGHGRQDLGTDADVSRTVGWFTSQYPVLLPMKYPSDLARQLIEVKETLRLVPAKGIGYGILKYMSDSAAVADLAFTLNPEVCFNYLGHFHSTPGGEDQPFFTFSGEDKGRDVHPAYERPHPIEVSASVFHDHLRVWIEYSPVQFAAETMQQLVDCYEQVLLALVRHCLSVETAQVTPSDLGDPEMPMEVLENLFD